MCAAMAPSGGRSPYGPPATNAGLNEAAAYAYDLEGGNAVAANGRNSLYDSRTLAAGGYDVRAKHGPPMAATAGYYPNEEEAHFGPPGTSSFVPEPYPVDGGGYYQPPRPPRGQQQAAVNWYGAGGGSNMAMAPAAGFIEDEYVTAFSDEEADDLDSRMARVQGGAFEPHGRAKSLMRYNELERERSRRRQTIVKQKTSSKLFPSKLKLSMMNTGLIPLKKGKTH
jgi:hypothetical protein